MDMYVQCKFKNENSETTAWIPEEGAEVGKSMLFKGDDDKKRWTVVEVFNATKMSKRDLDSKRYNVFESIK